MDSPLTATAPVVCAFDKTLHASVQALHDYLKEWRLKQETYYHEYCPRRDRLTGELIPYRDYAQYHSAEFASKVNLKRWIKDNREAGLAWSIEWLRHRRAAKALVYAPSQVEMRTVMCPSIPYYDSVAAGQGGYQGVTEALGYLTRYPTPRALTFSPLPEGAAVLVDTREQAPLRFAAGVVTRSETIRVGDYALAQPHDAGLRIERKSLSDFCGTMSGRKVKHERKTKVTVDSAFARFDRELARAVEANLYVVMIVESDINEAQSFNYLPQFRHLKVSPHYVMHQLRDLLTRYPLHFQALFVDGRAAMATTVVRLFELGPQVRTTDLQLALEEKRL